jgi:phosphoserine phosphatase
MCWIDEGIAADIGFDGDIAAVRDALAPLMGKFDICLQLTDHRRKMLIVSDMDSTMITVECIDELADFAGIKPQIAEITERAMHGELDFAEALRARVALLKGLDESVVATCLAERVQHMPGARTLLRTMSGWGAHSLLVSGGFTHFAGPVGEQLGFAAVRANELGFENGKLTGEVQGNIVDATTKRMLLEDATLSHGLIGAQTLAVGDGANDILMIEAAGLGVAYHAKPKAAAAADFAVHHNDLTALLYAQGVSRRDWVT